MTLPGTKVLSRENPPASSAEVNTGTWFVAGLTERGPIDEAVLVRNLSQAVDTFGDRVSYGQLYDALDVFFREGGSRAYVGRVVGPNPTTATVNVTDGSVNTLRIDAKNPGTWGANVSVVVAAGSGAGTFTITVEYNGDAVETSPDLADNAEAVAWAASSNYINLTDLGGANPQPGTTALVGGSDDHTNATDIQWTNALNLFPKSLGPGQVSMPGRTTAAAHAAQLAHASLNNRFAMVDFADTHDRATLVGAAAANRALADARYGFGFAPWAVVPGIAAGTTRTVPYSAIQAGLIARFEATGVTPNEAAAGVNGISRYALGLSQAAWSDPDREALNDGGVNVARIINGAVRTYGYRSFVNPLTDPTWLMATNGRLYMAIAADCDAVGERYEFAQIDGKRLKLNDFNGDLVGVLIPYYSAGALYGQTFADAASVDTGDQVNTDQTIADRQILAVVTVAMSPFGEEVTIEVVKVTNTEAS